MGKRQKRQKSLNAEVVRLPESSKIGDSAAVYGEEGTNKTMPVPKPAAGPAPELQGTKSKFVPPSPYTRG